VPAPPFFDLPLFLESNSVSYLGKGSAIFGVTDKLLLAPAIDSSAYAPLHCRFCIGAVHKDAFLRNPLPVFILGSCRNS
jgi:hypothetical protein